MGSLIGCAAASASVKFIKEEGLVQRSAQLGEYFLKGLKDLQERHEIIGDLDGRGLFIGMEFVKDRKTKEHAYEETLEIQHEARKRGLLFTRGGYGNRINILPPLVIDKDQIDEAIEILDEAIAEVERKV